MSPPTRYVNANNALFQTLPGPQGKYQHNAANSEMTAHRNNCCCCPTDSAAAAGTLYPHQQGVAANAMATNGSFDPLGFQTVPSGDAQFFVNSYFSANPQNTSNRLPMNSVVNQPANHTMNGPPNPSVTALRAHTLRPRPAPSMRPPPAPIANVHSQPIPSMFSTNTAVVGNGHRPHSVHSAHSNNGDMNGMNGLLRSLSAPGPSSVTQGDLTSFDNFHSNGLSAYDAFDGINGFNGFNGFGGINGFNAFGGDLAPDAPTAMPSVASLGAKEAMPADLRQTVPRTLPPQQQRVHSVQQQRVQHQQQQQQQPITIQPAPAHRVNVSNISTVSNLSYPPPVYPQKTSSPPIASAVPPMEAIPKGTSPETECKFQCKLCNSRWFETEEALSVHMNTHLIMRRTTQKHSGDPSKPWKCEVCDRKFAEKCTLKRHIRIHTKEKPWKCKYCPKAFNQSCSLQAHVRVHTGERPFPCSFCPKRFRQSTHRRQHCKRVHKEEFERAQQRRDSVRENGE